MKYEQVQKAVFLRRPNRFIAHVLLDGAEAVCHVKNTGRCRELLVPGAEVYVQRAANPARKTAWDLIAVQKGERLINMDAAAPNAVFGEWLRTGGAGFVPELVQPESRHGDSRFDFYFETGGRRVFAEVKGVTLEAEAVCARLGLGERVKLNIAQLWKALRSDPDTLILEASGLHRKRTLRLLEAWAEEFAG